VNAVAATTGPLGALAALLTPSVPASTSAATPIFLNLISAFFGSQTSDATLTVPKNTGSVKESPPPTPRRIADALIRSMLGDHTVHLIPPQPAAAATPIANTPAPAIAGRDSVPNNPVPAATPPQPLPPPVSEPPPLPITATPPVPAQPTPPVAAASQNPPPAHPPRKPAQAPLRKPTPQKIILSPLPAAVPMPQIATAQAVTMPVPAAGPMVAPANLNPQAESILQPAADSTAAGQIPLTSKPAEILPAPAPPNELAFSARLISLGPPDDPLAAVPSSEASAPPAAVEPNAQSGDSPRADTPPPPQSTVSQPPPPPSPGAAIPPIFATPVIRRVPGAPEQSHNPPKPLRSQMPPPQPPPSQAAEAPSAPARATQAPQTAGHIITAVDPIASMVDSTRPFESPLAHLTPAPGSEIQSQPPAAAETVPASEPQGVARLQTPAIPTPTIQGISVRIVQPEAPSVDLRVAQRAGEIQVSVRTPDAALQTSLRQDLGTLTSSLERAGYRTDTFVPRGVASVTGEVSSQPDRREDRPAQEASSRGASGDPRERNQHQQQQQHNPRGQHASGWLDELELTK
jgi:hypothetical protein